MQTTKIYVKTNERLQQNFEASHGFTSGPLLLLKAATCLGQNFIVNSEPKMKKFFPTKK